MNIFLKNNKIFFAIIIGALIIGGFIYLGIKSKDIVASKNNQVEIASSASPSHDNVKPAESRTSPATVCSTKENSFVTKVIDGDTIVVEGGWHVRLLGMDADEKGYPCYDSAKNQLENLVLGKNVVLEKDKTDVDQYGRCLRYIFVGNTNVDTQLVAEGLAIARFYAPDLKYKDDITRAEKQAQENKIGCKWSGNSQTITK